MSSAQVEIAAFQAEATDTDAEADRLDTGSDSDLEFDPAELSAADEDYKRSAVLDYYHNEREYAAERIAREVFEDEVSGETIRNWLEKHGLKAATGSLQSLSKHTGGEPLVELGALARKNGDCLIETSLEELLEKYGDEIAEESTAE